MVVVVDGGRGCSEDERMQHLVDKLLPYFECQEARMKKRLLCFLGLDAAEKSVALYQKGGGPVTCEMEALSKATTSQVMGALKASSSAVMLHLMPDSACPGAQRLKCPHMVVSVRGAKFRR
ncbi:hypothetical protein GNI_059890 [Gregarina niphandrodes]|uniref:Uncharacterized protein n=1 Tax=Gregarina niphandrodes TaxID=110365 RepID=A0A023B8F9_GRENI|nr:hypothetical protein GNI_059890 [Gregarina niphandrodes]EZG69116.1 hypothetical protein GNI_059890 [Gregarina niphandrodes]|eukprot:XP_011134496.1 hypothetical protein GNI_059890 [Gregarina niphandrodes]